jgi:hypothetical protein
MTFYQLIDERNRGLLGDIQKHLEVDIQICKGKDYSHRVVERKAIIYVPGNNYSPALFTHELLHIWLRKKQIFVTDFLLQGLEKESLLNWSVSDNLFEQMGHFLEDVKILPEFIRLGFGESEFAEDFLVPRCTFMHTEIIHSGMRKPIPSMASIDMFIHKFFAMKVDPNILHDYNGIMEDFRKINEELFAILCEFWEQWRDFDIECYDATKYSYKGFTGKFLRELGRWAVVNIHVKTQILENSLQH